MDSNATKRELQATFVEGMAKRVRTLGEKHGFTAASLGKAVGIPSSSVANYWEGKRPWPVEFVPQLADALSTNVEYLLRGVSTNAGTLRSVDDSDWIDIPEYDLRELTDEDRGPIVSTTPIRKDWLNRTLNQSSGLWLARLPADLPSLQLHEGDLVFCRNVEPGEAQDGAVYIVRIWGHLTVARIDSMLGNRMNSTEANLRDRALAPRDVGTDDEKAILIARVLGAPLRRL